MFPVILDVNHPSFFKCLDNCAEANLALVEIDSKEKAHLGHLLQSCSFFAQRLLNYFIIAKNLINLYLLKPLNSEKDWNTIL